MSAELDQLDKFSQMFEADLDAMTNTDNLREEKLIVFINPTKTPKRIDGVCVPNLRRGNELEIQRFARERGAYGYTITTLLTGSVKVMDLEIPFDKISTTSEQNSPITYINGVIVELAEISKDRKWKRQAKFYLDSGVTKGVLFIENKKSKNSLPPKLFPLRQQDRVIIV